VANGVTSALSDKGDLQDHWASLITQNFCRFSIQARRESNFEIHAWTKSDQGFVVARFTTVAGCAQLNRTAAEIDADGRDSYCLYLPLRGEQQIQQCARATQCLPDSLTLVSIGEPFVQTKLGDNDTLYLLMPRAFVDQRVIRGEELCARAVSPQHGIRRLAIDTVTALQREVSRMNGAEFLCAARVASDLVLLALAGAADLMSQTRSIRASNLARAKRVIRARLAVADLRLSDIASECGLSLRYLHDLFRDDGRTVREYLQSERLLKARRMLEVSQARAATVTDICLACGFSNTSQFSTAFRRSFGISPRDVLRRA
jgi:AraC-like DNA-binding protein